MSNPLYPTDLPPDECDIVLTARYEAVANPMSKAEWLKEADEIIAEGNDDAVFAHLIKGVYVPEIAKRITKSLAEFEEVQHD